jgi:hypothetical protein
MVRVFELSEEIEIFLFKKETSLASYFSDVSLVTAVGVPCRMSSAC